ncbi:hypothetical protein F444_18821 [Phytophthora nicotianae P1976]|nr:hypothetical protein F444_18821 [Phytophthora nicotianae P1976]
MSATTSLISWSIAHEYFLQFSNYICSPERLHKLASEFLHKIMAPDVMDGSQVGVDAQLGNWRNFAFYFGEARVELKYLMSRSSKLDAGTVISVTITRTTLLRAYSHLVIDDADGGMLSPLAHRMLGKKLVMRGSVLFGWDNTTDKIVSFHSQADMITPMLNLLGNLKDVSCVFSKARITPECKFV